MTWSDIAWPSRKSGRRRSRPVCSSCLRPSTGQSAPLDSGCGAGSARLCARAVRGERRRCRSLGGVGRRRQRARARELRADRRRRDPLPFEYGSFDIVGCMRVLHHARRPELVVSELARVTRPGGRILVIDQIGVRRPCRLGGDRPVRESPRSVAHAAAADQDIRGSWTPTTSTSSRTRSSRAARPRALPSTSSASRATSADASAAWRRAPSTTSRSAGTWRASAAACRSRGAGRGLAVAPPTGDRRDTPRGRARARGVGGSPVQSSRVGRGTRARRARPCRARSRRAPRSRPAPGRPRTGDREASRRSVDVETRRRHEPRQDRVHLDSGAARCCRSDRENATWACFEAEYGGGRCEDDRSADRRDRRHMGRLAVRAASCEAAETPRDTTRSRGSSRAAPVPQCPRAARRRSAAHEDARVDYEQVDRGCRPRMRGPWRRDRGAVAQHRRPRSRR